MTFVTVRPSSTVYESERALVDDFMARLESASPWGIVRTNSEFFYQRGKTDVVAVAEDGEVLAFEAKLTKWRDALHQAYRNTCFAHRSYVVLPKDVALQASRHVHAFRQRCVGICYIEQAEVVVLEDASQATPIQPWLSARAKTHVYAEQDGDGVDA